jgi:tetratricopeptide (TPR) repeat protein
LNPTQGFTPALPAGLKNIHNVHDLILRAKAGLTSNDAQKEAHTAYYLATYNEEQSLLKPALSLYKRFYFLSRALDDPIASSFALNRLGVVYFKLRKIDKSLHFHLKHSKSSDTDNVFAAYYNIGLCYRILQDFQKAHWYFSKAREWAQFTENRENEFLCQGQIGITLFLNKDQI